MSGGSQTERKPLAEMIVLINWFAMIVLLVKRGGGEIWQSISGKPNVQTNFFWKPLGVIIHRQQAQDESQLEAGACRDQRAVVGVQHLVEGVPRPRHHEEHPDDERRQP